MIVKLALLAAVALTGLACATIPPSSDPAPATPVPADKASLVVAGGCFWCVEAIYEELNGVIAVESGYTGGTTANPTYEQVCSGSTGHAEAVKIIFDPKVIDRADLLRIFFTTHDPTQLNRQGNDIGTQYRSAIFYSTQEEKALADKIIAEVEREKVYDKPIVTKVEPLGTYYMAESYHQNYFERYEKASDAERGRMNAGYCSAIISPKVSKFRHKYADKLKKKG